MQAATNLGVFFFVVNNFPQLLILYPGAVCVSNGSLHGFLCALGGLLTLQIGGTGTRLHIIKTPTRVDSSTWC